MQQNNSKKWSFLLSLTMIAIGPRSPTQTHSYIRDSATSAMSALVALSLFVVSTVATGEFEALEPSCLLQKAQEQLEQQLVARELHQQKPLEQQLQEQVQQLAAPAAPPGTTFVCGPNCRCTDYVQPVQGLNAVQCFEHCQGFLGFIFAPNGQTPGTTDCQCCRDLNRVEQVKTEWYLYSQMLPPPAPSGYELLCGPNCRCANYVMSVKGLDIGACFEHCQSFPRFIYAPLGPPTDTSDCRCCPDLEQVTENVRTQWYLYGSGTGTGSKTIVFDDSGKGTVGISTGDPHITTFDGRHYTLLSQGTFSLWHFSGVETDFHSETGGTKKFPVDWQVYAHYSGRQSFTKGLLLVDKSGGSMRQMLEITSQDCKWKARKGNEEWTVVDPVHNELISVLDGGEYVTGFDLSRTETAPHGHRFPNRVSFNMNTKNGKSDIAVLSLSCRPSHNINAQISMKHKSDQQFVDGELKAARKSLSTLQTSTDSEFSVDSKWQELGGSEKAALYLQQLDENRAPLALLESSGCGDAEKESAKLTCYKHLGEHDREDAHFLEDCIYDLCHGAGETQAELVAELIATTRTK